jgi:hypothetical protein
MGLIHNIAVFSPTTDSLMMLYFALVESKFKCVSATWISVMISDSSKSERIERKSEALYQGIFSKYSVSLR